MKFKMRIPKEVPSAPPEGGEQRMSGDEDGPVYRRKPLPVGELRGTFLVSEPVIAATREALVSFALSGIFDGGHEGMAFWVGRELEGCTVFLQAIVPDADHWAQRVQASREAVGHVQRAAHAQRLGILCQVHSHPGGDARHSDGDDDMILLPFEGMLSVVVPNFGMNLTVQNVLQHACFHQFQESQWVLCTQGSVEKNVVIVAPSLDLR